MPRPRLLLAVREWTGHPSELPGSRVTHALGDLLGIVLAIDPDACGTTATPPAERAHR